MKSFGGLFEQICTPENLRAALQRAASGKRDHASVALFLANADDELARLQRELLQGVYHPGPYYQFSIRDPKPRRISCAPFRDRVVHHALCEAIAPCLERRFIADSYACRKGKGTHRAASRAREFCRRFSYVCKLDVRGFFDSVDHEHLLGVLLPMFRERAMRELLVAIIRHPYPGQQPGKGLPIGNLTSQWFANLYLDGADHYVTETVRPAAYLRYMDDMLLFDTDKAALWARRDALVYWLNNKRALSINDRASVLLPVSEGVPFLGLRIFPRAWRLQRSRLRRSRRLLHSREQAYLAGELSMEQLADSTRAVVASSQSYGFRNLYQGEVEI